MQHNNLHKFISIQLPLPPGGRILRQLPGFTDPPPNSPASSNPSSPTRIIGMTVKQAREHLNKPVRVVKRDGEAVIVPLPFTDVPVYYPVCVETIDDKITNVVRYG